MLHVAHPHEVERRRVAWTAPMDAGYRGGSHFCVMENTVDILGLRQELPRQPVGQIFTHEGYPEIAVVDLGRDVSDVLRDSWDAGRPFESGGVIESAWLQPLFGSVGAAASSLLAGNVFLATANPATLMTIRAGVGSAVMGPAGIVANAPFIAASSALLPVVAPVMLFMTVSSMITGARLDRMQKTLGALSEVLDRVRHLMEAEAYAKFRSATKRLDEIRLQFEHSHRFTDGMKLELVQARGDLNLLHYQYEHLANREIRSESHARMAVSDINLFFLSSLMDIRADVLRLYLTLQDDPGFAGRYQAELSRKVERCNNTFRALLNEDPIEGLHKALQQELSEVEFYHLPSQFKMRFGGGLPARIRNVEAIREAFKPIRECIERWTGAFESAGGVACEQSIVVYQDRAGARALHAHHTRDLRLQQAGA